MTEEEKKLLELQQAQAAEQAATPIKQPTTEEAPEVSTPAAQQQQQQSGAMLDDIFRQYEQRKKNDAEADKRDRRLKILNSVGDVAHALSNLYFTTQYAPNSYKGGNAEKSQAAYANAKGTRDRETDSWMRYMLNYAGKKQADEAAEEAAKQRAAEKQEKAKQAAQKESERKEDKAIKQYADTYSPLWRSWARDGKAERLDDEMKELQRMFDAGKISQREYEGKRDAITKAINTVADRNSQTEYNSQHKTTGRGGSGGSKVDTIYTPFGDVSWPKDKTGKTYGQNLGDAFKELPQEYQDRITGSPTIRQMEWAFDNFFYNPKYSQEQKIAVYNKLVEVGKRNQPKPQPKPKPQGGGSLLPKMNKSKGSLLPNK